MSSNNPKNVLNVQTRENSSGHGGSRHGSGRKRKFPEQSTHINSPTSEDTAAASTTADSSRQIRKIASAQTGRANFWSTRAPQGPSALHDADNPLDPASTIPSALPSLTSAFESIWADLGVLQAESEDQSSAGENGRGQMMKTMQQ
ncbi:hypothetical protein B0H10DRAFT_1960550 [Mycena sp. CBHHK59/15]|nr:hypothetical protein B0H10DRAFT_1960550 [Mycena sp. CBHHK59/15]